jgi:deferrochelatase/peroxidase EfeB
VSAPARPGRRRRPRLPEAADAAFHDAHQPGVATRQQAHVALAAFDVVDDATPDDVRDVLAAWSAAAARLMAGGRSAQDVDAGRDGGEAHELVPAGLTLTFGLGPGLFDPARFGLADRRPIGLEPLPAFACDALDERRCGGDLCVQACADDPQVAFHAIHALTRAAHGIARPRWAQTGFVRRGTVEDRGRTPRNLLGFREGASNLRDPGQLARHVWVDRGDRTGMRGGTYLVVRRIRADLEAWDAAPIAAQERAVGRTKVTGARLEAPDRDAHTVRAGPALNGGARLLRRSYNFFDGVDTATGALDAGLLLLCFQRDPRRQYAPIQRALDAQDALARYGVHTGSAVFAIPPGCRPGGYVGEPLLEAP